MTKSFRLRLTAWYLLFFTSVLVVFSVFLYHLLGNALYERMDDSLLSEANTAAGLFQDELEESKGDIPLAAQQAVSEMRGHGLLIAIFANGRILAAGSHANQSGLNALAARAGKRLAPERLTAGSQSGAGMRALAYPFEVNGGKFVLLAAEPLDAIRDDLRLVRRVFFFTLPVALLLASFGGYWLATRSLAPVRRMAEQAKRITDRNLNSRLDAGAASQELQLLADSFNELLSRLDQSFASMRRFVADASHELRTPLSVIRGEADVALASDRSHAEYKESIAVMQDEARRLSRLVDDLLNLTRADAESVKLRLEPFYLNDLLSECCRSVQPIAGSKGIELGCRCPGDVMFNGDQELLRRLLFNLLENAIRYTPAGGKVAMNLGVEEEAVRIEVSDTGIGIPADAAPHVFERFYRADQARSREQGGFGLGLSIVKWIAETHHGTVQLTSQPGVGSTFTVLLQK
jgi:heavy metal sensor kinase